MVYISDKKVQILEMDMGILKLPTDKFVVS